ncbi:MAG TPA: PBP1A family penicillin-binding protein [Patescibacteria group bacterium]
MAKKRPLFNKSNNPLQAIGRPLFKITIYFISFLGLTLLLFFRILEKIRTLSVLRFPKLPVLRKPQINLKIGRLPSIKLPRLPSFLPPKLTFPKLEVKKPKIYYRVIFVTLTFGFLCGFLYYEFIYTLPDPALLKNYPSKLTTQILDRNGKLLYKIYKDENRTLIKIDDLPGYVKQAFLAAEDKDFYQHNGFSIIGIARAIYKNFTDDKLEGGSTITQQLVKNTLLSNEKTIDRKIKELILAILVEKDFSKNEIFEMYLNQVGFGGPAYGIQEASRQYFNIDAKNLDLAQAAFLAGMPQAPSKYSPYGDNPELSKTRQKLVLYQMYKDNFISEKQFNTASTEPLVFNSAKTEIKAPHFVMYIKDLLTDQLGENLLNNGGLIITTTLDSDLQEEAQKEVTKEIATLKNYHVSNGAALVTNPNNGEILAMVGSKDYFNLNEDGQVNLTTSLRQPGSSIKPLNYALAFENGYNPASIVEDKPISFNIIGQGIWTPKNYDGRFHGIVTLRQALGSSYNIPSVILLSKNGINNFANLAQKMGITSWTDPSRFGLSMALGSLEVKMVDMATAYSAFANNGKVTPLKAILKIQQPNGKQIFVASCPNQPVLNPEKAAANAEEQSCSPRQVISPTTAYLISDILADNSARAPAFGFNSVLNIPNARVSVKTGTSNDLRDNWAVGYTKDYLVATWVGNNNNEPMSNIASGITGASPIWSQIMRYLVDKQPPKTEITPPADLVKIPICKLTGTLTCEGCPTEYEYFEKGKEPTVRCQPDEIKRLLSPSPSSAPGAPQIL